MVEIVQAFLKLNETSDKRLLNRHKYPAFDTEEVDVEKWWNSLNRGKFYLLGRKKQFYLKIEVGSLAVDQGFMTPNFRFDCGKTKFHELTIRQKKIIKLAFLCKDEVYSDFPLRGLCGKLFRV